MENIFYKTGYKISCSSSNPADDKIVLLQINNIDGTPRWIWNAENAKPLFLKFYNIGSFRALLFAAMIHLVFALKLQKYIFKSQKFFIKKINNVLFDYKKDWAIFTGTVGPNNKAVLFDGDKFIKIATTFTSEQLLKNEYQILQKLNKAKVNFDFPFCIDNTNDSLTISDVSGDGIRLKELNSNALNVLTELYSVENKSIKIKNWDYLNQLISNYKNIKKDRISKNLLRKMDLLINEINPEETIELSFSHGDFTQWNMFEANNNIAIYDWELASNDNPKGFDFFHFILQNDVLVNHKSWKSIYFNIQKQAQNNFFKTVFNNNIEELNKYLKWYLLVNCLHYLALYSAQPKWHLQVNWLLSVWNESLNMFLKSQKTARELIIMDLFDLISNQEYAALKLEDQLPEQLSINSDIDLVITKKNEAEIVAFLANHSLVSKIKTCRKSFMNSIQIITNEAEILSLDLIWQFKQKNIEFLDATKVLATKNTNSFGIKNASNLFTARYIFMFHMLNNSKVPSKYLDYQCFLQKSNNPLDITIANNYGLLNKEELLSFLKKQPANSLFNAAINSFNYFLDTLKNIKSNSGFIITFSGVDGAGKTTVIENIAFRIEKQFRKPVVVLRHRPSILPILSVWTKGKVKAHLSSVSNLPRQGTNGSFLSSLLRFFYYYLDYLIGQFVIYFKYIFKGYIVIYDRYYFDFINDSKRSNIVLPKSISTIGYRFLLKPKFNFFLFADAKTILKRKQELNENTINELTRDYDFLFQNLQLTTNTTVYKSINNEDLETTLINIIKTIIKK